MVRRSVAGNRSGARRRAPQEPGTLTISSTFYMDWQIGTVGPELAEVYTNGHTHSWTLTLHGTTNSHEYFIGAYGVTN